MSKRFLYVRSNHFDKSWPFSSERMLAGLRPLGEVDEVVLEGEQGKQPLSEHLDLSKYTGISWFGGKFTPECVAAAKNLKVIGCLSDNTGGGLDVAGLAERGIPVIDSTRAWGQSVAECGFTLALCALRRTTWWAHRMASGEENLFHFPNAQFCDDPEMVNGDLGTKTVGVMGLGAIGGRLARWSKALGATVVGYDPFMPEEVVRGWGVEPVDIDTLVDRAEVVMVAIPPVPSAENLLNAERVDRLKKGAVIMIVTRAFCVDMQAVRRRILANEMVGAFDVYDKEPVAPDDPLVGRSNVVHTPHIAGRTRDSNWRLADIITEDFARVLKGEKPLAALSPKAAAVRRGEVKA